MSKDIDSTVWLNRFCKDLIAGGMSGIIAKTLGNCLFIHVNFSLNYVHTQLFPLTVGNNYISLSLVNSIYAYILLFVKLHRLIVSNCSCKHNE